MPVAESELLKLPPVVVVSTEIDQLSGATPVDPEDHASKLEFLTTFSNIVIVGAAVVTVI